MNYLKGDFKEAIEDYTQAVELLVLKTLSCCRGRASAPTTAPSLGPGSFESTRASSTL